MFFSISKTNFDERFTDFKKVNDVYISLDPGWSHITRDDYEVFIKGYSDDCDLDTVVADTITTPIPSHHGNYGIILLKDNKITVSHSYTRPFYLWIYNNNTEQFKITNLPYEEYSTQYPFIVWENDNYLHYKIETKSPAQTYVMANTIVQITGNQTQFLEYDAYSIPEFDKKLSIDECIGNIYTILSDKVGQFKSTIKDKQLKVYLSGGLDTMLVYSFIKELVKHNDYEFGEYIERNTFIDKNLNYLDNTFTHYQTIFIHHWNTPTIFATGGGGEEFLCKEFYATALWSAWKGIDFIQLIQSKTQNFYRKYYYQRPALQKYFGILLQQHEKIKSMFPTYQDLCEHIIKLKLNENQHWHLANTLTWTPLNDVRIVRQILRLNDDDLLDHFLYNTIEFTLLDINDSSLKTYISKFKNFNEHKNFLKFMPYRRYLAKEIITNNNNRSTMYDTIYRKLNIKEHIDAGVNDNDDLYYSKW